MKRRIELALKHLIRAKPHLAAALSKRHWSFMHEDLDYLIISCQGILKALAKGEKLPR